MGRTLSDYQRFIELMEDFAIEYVILGSHEVEDRCVLMAQGMKKVEGGYALVAAYHFDEHGRFETLELRDDVVETDAISHQ